MLYSTLLCCVGGYRAWTQDCTAVCDWRPVAIKLYPSGRQSHSNCTCVADNRMQIVPTWLPVACNMNEIDRNLHATGSHVVTICMRLVAPRFQDKRQADKRYVKSWLYIIIIFFSIGKSTSSMHASDYLADEPWFGNCAGTMDDIAKQKKIMHALAVSCL